MAICIQSQCMHAIQDEYITKGELLAESAIARALEVAAPSSLNLIEAVRGRPAAEVRALIADLKAELETLLEREPENYGALVLLGELNLRVGLSRQAQALLYRASLQQPPTWAAFQRTSYLLRRAEEQRQKAFDRVAGAAPPRTLRRAAAAAWSCVHGLSGKSNPSQEAGA